MSEKSRRVRNPIVQDALQWHAEVLHLELVSYKHVTLERLEIAFRLMHDADEKIRHTGQRCIDLVHQQSGVSISVKRRPALPRR